MREHKKIADKITKSLAPCDILTANEQLYTRFFQFIRIEWRVRKQLAYREIPLSGRLWRWRHLDVPLDIFIEQGDGRLKR